MINNLFLEQAAHAATEACYKAGDCIRQHFRNLPNWNDKNDASPVTAADTAAEQIIRTHLKTIFPTHTIIGEEFASENIGQDFAWIIDPIDGTKAFICGKPIFGTLLGLCYRGEPILGVLYQPISQELWLGVQGKPTTFNGVPIVKKPVDILLEKAALATTGPQYFSASELATFNAIAEKTAFVSYGGDCYNYGLLALQHISLIIEAGLKFHDIAALIPIIKGAGGAITTWQGAPICYSTNTSLQVVAAANSTLLESVLPFLNDHRS